MGALLSGGRLVYWRARERGRVPEFYITASRAAPGAGLASISIAAVVVHGSPVAARKAGRDAY